MPRTQTETTEEYVARMCAEFAAEGDGYVPPSVRNIGRTSAPAAPTGDVPYVAWGRPDEIIDRAPGRPSGERAQTAPTAGEVAGYVRETRSWLRTIDRKVADDDIRPARLAAAQAFLHAYTGDFAFLVDLRDRRRALSTGQARGVLNCWRAELARRAAATPAPVAAQATQAAAQATQAAPAASSSDPARDLLGTVPAGRYAIDGPAGTKFYRVAEGRVRLFVDAQASDDWHPLRDRARIGEVLTAIAADPQAAMLRYGRELGACGHCGRTLTDPESIALGIGPVCRTRMGW